MQNIINEVYNELLNRGFDVTLLEMFSCISHQSSYQTSLQFWFDKYDEASWNGVKIMSTRIEMDNDLNLGQKLFICNHFNKNIDYCTSFLSDDDNEYFAISTCVSVKCENIVNMCANMFEEVINATEYLIELINNS